MAFGADGSVRGGVSGAAGGGSGDRDARSPEVFRDPGRQRQVAAPLSGRAQLAAEKFAYSIETLPLVLAENAGMDPLDTQVQLRTKATTTAKPKYGIDVHGAKIEDLSVKDIYDPLAIKERVITSATETACMILRIDNVISASKSTAPSGPTPGGAGGYGGGAGDYD